MHLNLNVTPSSQRKVIITVYLEGSEAKIVQVITYIRSRMGERFHLLC